ncbi:MAG: ABC transporter ATP-binding protein [Candidatus Nanopelagicales bacterium]
MDYALRTERLVVGYDGWASGVIDLEVAPGSITAILGPSGCGKSTLLSTIAGIRPALSGRILIDGEDVTGLPANERTAGMVFQEPLLFPNYDVARNVGYGLERNGMSRREARAQALELLDWVGLAGFGDRAVDELSGGQAQRVALVRALAPRPTVVLLDEPFSALDVDLRQRLAHEVSELLRARGVAAVHVTHDPAEAVAIADTVLRFDDIYH